MLRIFLSLPLQRCTKFTSHVFQKKLFFKSPTRSYSNPQTELRLGMISALGEAMLTVVGLYMLISIRSSCEQSAKKLEEMSVELKNLSNQIEKIAKDSKK